MLFCFKALGFLNNHSRCSTTELALSMQISPVTANSFLEVIQVPEGENLLQQAANSVLGKGLISMAQKGDTKTINLVRRHEVAEELEQLGYTSFTS